MQASVLKAGIWKAKKYMYQLYKTCMILRLALEVPVILQFTQSFLKEISHAISEPLEDAPRPPYKHASQAFVFKAPPPIPPLFPLANMLCCPCLC